MRKIVIIRLDGSGMFLSNKGLTRYEKEAVQFSSPLQAIRFAEKRSGMIDEPIKLVGRIVK